MFTFRVEHMTPEQTAAYVNATTTVVFAELLAKHWENVNAQANGKPLPHREGSFVHTVQRHCVNHTDVMSLFERQYLANPKLAPIEKSPK